MPVKNSRSPRGSSAAVEDYLERILELIKSKGYARVVSGLSSGDTVIVAGSLQVDELWHAAHGQG